MLGSSGREEGEHSAIGGVERYEVEDTRQDRGRRDDASHGGPVGREDRSEALVRGCFRRARRVGVGLFHGGDLRLSSLLAWRTRGNGLAPAVSAERRSASVCRRSFPRAASPASESRSRRSGTARRQVRAPAQLARFHYVPPAGADRRAAAAAGLPWESAVPSVWRQKAEWIDLIRARANRDRP